MGMGKDRYQVKPHGVFHMVYDTLTKSMVEGDLTLNEARKKKSLLDSRHRKRQD